MVALQAALRLLAVAAALSSVAHYATISSNQLLRWAALTASLVAAPVLLFFLEAAHTLHRTPVLPGSIGRHFGRFTPPDASDTGRRRTADTLRLLILGDSFGEGVGVEGTVSTSQHLYVQA